MRQEGPLFAHADGHITDNESKLLQLDSAIESIISHNSALYCITDSGKAIGYNDKIEQLWSMQFNKPNLQAIGFVIGKFPHIGLQFQMESMEVFRCWTVTTEKCCVKCHQNHQKQYTQIVIL